MRAPDPMRECRPGGSCPECNPRPAYCQTCLDVVVENVDEPCEACAAAAEEERAMNEERIAALRKIADEAWKDSTAAMVRHYEATAEIARLRDDPLTEEFDAALAACYRGEPGATERKDRAYLRLQASRCMDGNYEGIDEKNLAAVRAEVERMRAAAVVAPASDLAAQCGE